jgi:predicted RNA-binding Zn-ribbon protein involved in translation (DUF1610 family)
MDYINLQSEWIRNNNLKIGSKVKVVKTAASFEYGWGNDWVLRMDRFVGKVYPIYHFSGSAGITLDDDEENLSFDFPYFVLEPVDSVQVEVKSCKHECPRCSATLTRVRSYVYNVEIDKCPACGWC